MERLCRLCGKIVNSDNLEIIGEIEKEMLDVLLKLSFSPSEKSVMCSRCAEELGKCFQFKANCLYTEDYIFPLIKQWNKIDMLQIYKNNNDQKNGITITDDEDICRLCMEIFENRSLSILNEVDRDMLQICIPEVNVTATQRTLFCKTCLTSLTFNFNFTRRCMEAEKKITSFKNGNRNKFQVMLIRVEQFIQGIKTSSPRENLDNSKNKIEDDCNLDDESYQRNTSSDTMNFGYQNNKSLRIKLSKPGSLHQKSESLVQYRCEYCTYESNCRPNLNSHLLTHKSNSEVKMFSCSLCTFKTKWSSCWSRHKTRHKNKSKGTTYGCFHCSYKTTQKYYLTRHMKRHRNISYTINYESQNSKSLQIKSNKSVSLHQKSESLVQYRCEYCTYESNYRCNLNNHLLAHKSYSEVKMFSCSLCTFKTKWRSCWSRHNTRHKNKSKGTTYGCFHCSYKTTQKYYLTRHMMAHRNRDELISYKCNTCGYQSTSKGNLSTHMSVHKNKNQSKLQLHSCEKCTFTTRHRNSLQRHMLSHMDMSQLNMYKCEMCSYKAIRRDHLKRHSLIHQASENCLSLNM